MTSVPAGRLEAVGDERAPRQAAAGERHDRAQAQRLGDRRPQVVLLAGLERVAQAPQRRRVAEQQVEGPGERRRGRLVAGEQQGHQLVAQVGVVHRPRRPRSGPASAPRGCRRAPRGRRRGGARRSRRRAARRPRAAGPRTGPTARGRRSGAATRATQLGAGRGGLRQQPSRAARAGAPAAAPSATPKTTRRITSRVTACIRGWIGNSSPERPGVDLGVDDLLDHRLVGAHPLAVEGRQHQLAVGEVVGAFEQQQRARAEDRLEEDVAARRQAVARARCRGP